MTFIIVRKYKNNYKNKQQNKNACGAKIDAETQNIS